MSEFDSVLREYVMEQAAVADARYALDPTGEARVIAWRARRRRAARTGSIVAAAAAVVLVAGAGVYAATRPAPVPPADSPTPTVSPTPDESPTAQAPDPEPQGRPAVTDHPLLPDAAAIEPGMLAAAPAGSVLTEYVATCGYPCLTPTSPEVLYLVTPDGAIHEVAMDVDDLTLVDWFPGTSVALFSHWSGDASEWVAVDLDTGLSVGQRIGYDEWGDFDAWLGGNSDVLRVNRVWRDDRPVTVLERVSLSDGSVLASVETPGQPEVVWGPDRTHFFLRRSSGVAVYETRTLDPVGLPTMTDLFGYCHGVDWWDATSVLLSCDVLDGTTDDAGVMDLVDTVLRRVAFDGTVETLAEYPHSPPYPLMRLWHMGGRTVLATHPWAESGGYNLAPERMKFAALAGDDLTYVSADWGDADVTLLASTGTHVVASVSLPGEGTRLVLVDPATGSWTPLLTAPEPGWGAYLNAVPNGGRS